MYRFAPRHGLAARLAPPPIAALAGAAPRRSALCTVRCTLAAMPQHLGRRASQPAPRELAARVDEAAADGSAELEWSPRTGRGADAGRWRAVSAGFAPLGMLMTSFARCVITACLQH